jgi:hypothetical protein
VPAVGGLDKQPADWSDAQDNLRIALHSPGERESSDARLRKAAAAYRAGLRVETIVGTIGTM